jgi:DnaJ-class molecular chaperone
MSLFVNSPLPSSTLSARHAVASSRQHRRVVASKRTQTIHTTTRAGLLDGLFGVKDGEKRVNRPKPGTKTVMFCSCCKNKGQEKCPGCKGTGQVRER